jgi:hypothetical protein
MSTRLGDAVAPPPKPCRDCMEPIHRDALKCYRCGSFQRWPRGMSIQLLSAAMSLIALLVSVYALLN